jgi:hypothetical protein
MTVLNSVCYVSLLIFVGFILILAFMSFCISFYECFKKRKKGYMLPRIIVTIAFGCLCPWVLKLFVFLIDKLLML